MHGNTSIVGWWDAAEIELNLQKEVTLPKAA